MFRLKNRESGFTLIEMMVVIAIIAMLSASVLAAVSSARSKSKQSRVIADIQLAFAQAENYYNQQSGAYECTATGGDQVWWDISLRMVKNGGSDLKCTPYITGTVGKYKVTAKIEGKGVYCVDWDGNNKSDGSADAGRGC